MGDYPTDQLNLSFSGDECENLFVTESTFHEVNNQDVEDAVKYLNDFTDMSFGDCKALETIDLTNLSQESGSLCGKIFDFTDDHDNSWSVLNENAPFIVSRNSDGKVFTVLEMINHVFKVLIFLRRLIM